MYIELFIKEQKKRDAAENTVLAYERDLKAFCVFLEEKSVSSIAEASSSHIVSYLFQLQKEGKSKATINRKLACLRSFYAFLMEHDYVKNDITRDLKSPRVEKQKIEYLDVPTFETILSKEENEFMEIRNQLIIEVLYGTGIRASELLDLKISDFNFELNYLIVNGEKGVLRLIPLAKMTKRAILRYLEVLKSVNENETVIDEVHSKVKEKNEVKGLLFRNNRGEQLTRQGLWKIIKNYGEKFDLSMQLTPQLIRNSFVIHLLENGADEKTLQEILGVKELSIIEEYYKMKNNRIKDVFNSTHPRA